MKNGMARVLTATVIAVVTPRRTDDVVETLTGLSPAGVRSVIVSLGDDPKPDRREENGTTVIQGLLPRYLDNAVASLRLSSLPTVVWWQADAARVLGDLAALVDRIVLDTLEPRAVWSLVPEIATVAPISDLRWTRLTRWRELFAHFFEIPDVRRAAPTFDRLHVAGSDIDQARLAAGWFRSRLPAGDRLNVDLQHGESAGIERLRLSGTEGTLSVELLPNSSCLETRVQLGGAQSSPRVVAAGDQRLQTLFAEELRVRSRDLAFEDAVRAAERL